ncbi:ABC transporter ATP-binding protein [Halogeometricum borinquense]|uniref:ABC transporter ATP-binding protein n=1 Tax=Halogeometricum borinquense TaxID=60847 RepID=A0A6C0UHL3_9EURY|nr:ABC transporter ATP-binding protein [Halogeometricum borinquense]QIB74925.1 ABC transporter ATP-binding protein [Halogeometricum borinquense]QIQ76075.1 ABC transporter ATP-binding protein [Halogeometricum borinquense]
MSDERSSEASSVTLGEKLAALRTVISYDPTRFGGVVALSLVVAVFEGVGLSFLLPLVEAGRTSLTVASDQTVVSWFAAAYGTVGVPFTFETLLGGAALALGLRFGMATFVRYLQAQLVADYIRSLKTGVFRGILDADLSYVDERGSDELLNTLVTQSNYPATVLSSVLSVVERTLLVFTYLILALAVDPLLTTAVAALLGVITVGVRSVVGSAYGAGSGIASANTAIQSHAQAGVQGIRDVRLFGLDDVAATRYTDALDDYIDAVVGLRANQAIVSNLHRFAAAVVVLVAVYLALTWAALSLGAVGLLLFAMLRLGPGVSSLQSQLYGLDGKLPHLVETLRELDELAAARAVRGGDADVPEPVESVAFDGVSFRYPDGDQGVSNVSLRAGRGEFIAIVGGSGAGKSTIVSLLARLYAPDTGTIRVDGTDLSTVRVDDWRDRLAVVRQNPYIFDDTLRNNVLASAPEASEAAFERACADAGVTAFAEGLSDGYDTVLGEDGVRLSGGQKQRVAIARALLRDADVVVFDEATSNLDAQMEESVLGSVREATRNRVFVVVTHRLGSIVDADRIYTVADGRMVEDGTHEELVAAEGTYASLYASMSGFELGDTDSTDDSGGDGADHSDTESVAAADSD